MKTTFQEGVWKAAEKQGESRSQGESRWLLFEKKVGDPNKSNGMELWRPPGDWIWLKENGR